MITKTVGSNQPRNTSKLLLPAIYLPDIAVADHRSDRARFLERRLADESDLRLA
jgi:hypothetical protein